MSDLKEYQSNKIIKGVALKHLQLVGEYTMGENLQDKEFKLVTVNDDNIVVDITYLTKRMNLTYDNLQQLTFHPEGIPIGGYFVQYEDEYVSWSPEKAFTPNHTEIKPYYNIGVKSIGQDEYDDGIQELRLELNDGRVFNQRRKWSGSKAGGVIEAYYQLQDMSVHPDLMVRLVCKMSDYLDGDHFEKILWDELKLSQTEMI